jgi:hypothetical protein
MARETDRKELDEQPKQGMDLLSDETFRRLLQNARFSGRPYPFLHYG